MTITNDDPLLCRKQAAPYLGLTSPDTLRTWDCIGRYDLKPIKVGGRIRYRKSVLDALLRGELQGKPIKRRRS